MNYSLGIDLGGTKIEGVVLGDHHEVVFRERVPTEQWQGYAHILDQIEHLVVRMRRLAPDAHRIGVGTPGSISQRDDSMKNSNTECLNGRHLRQDLEARIDLDVVMENDANCFALAEAHSGAGKMRELVFGVILGTGVGGGIVCRGELLKGPQHLAGEWGHHRITDDGRRCYCGHVGCVETFLSGPALEKDYREESGVAMSAQEIAENSRLGREDHASLVFGRYLDRFGRALANVINILDPNVIVLGGGLSNIPELYTDGVESTRKYVFNDELLTPVVPNELEDSAGVIGAALLTRDGLEGGS